MTEILTDDGWVEFTGDPTDHSCECGEDAVTVTDVGTNQKPVLWAQCSDCATETAGDSHEGQRRSAYECDDLCDTHPAAAHMIGGYAS